MSPLTKIIIKKNKGNAQGPISLDWEKWARWNLSRSSAALFFFNELLGLPPAIPLWGETISRRCTNSRWSVVTRNVWGKRWNTQSFVPLRMERREMTSIADNHLYCSRNKKKAAAPIGDISISSFYISFQAPADGHSPFSRNILWKFIISCTYVQSFPNPRDAVESYEFQKESLSAVGTFFPPFQ